KVYQTFALVADNKTDYDAKEIIIFPKLRIIAFDNELPLIDSNSIKYYNSPEYKSIDQSYDNNLNLNKLFFSDSIDYKKAKVAIEKLKQSNITIYDKEIDNLNDEAEDIKLIKETENKPIGLDISTYIKNNHYFIKNINVNKDGISDKIVSHNRYQGDELLVFLGDGNGNYQFALKSTNFSEDGGNQISDINPTKDGFEIITAFPDRGQLQKKYLVSSINNSFILKKIETESYSWQDGYTESCLQNFNLNLKNSTEELFFNTIHETERHCTKTYESKSE